MVLKTLLMLHAHPNIPDAGSRTPLMVASLGPNEVREPPVYNGTMTNKALSWTTIQDVLDWNGRGEPPIRNGPEIRTVKGPGADRVRELLSGAKKGKTILPQINTKRRHRHDDDSDGGS